MFPYAHDSFSSAPAYGILVTWKYCWFWSYEEDKLLHHLIAHTCNRIVCGVTIPYSGSGESTSSPNRKYVTEIMAQ